MPCTSASHATAGTKRMDEIRAVMPAANRIAESVPFFWRSRLHQMRPPYCKTETATTTPIPDNSAGHWWRINCDSFEPTSLTCGVFLVSLCDSLDPPSLAVGTISGVPRVAGKSRARASKKSWDSGIHRRPAVAITPELRRLERECAIPILSSSPHPIVQCHKWHSEPIRIRYCKWYLPTS